MKEEKIAKLIAEKLVLQDRIASLEKQVDKYFKWWINEAGKRDKLEKCVEFFKREIKEKEIMTQIELLKKLRGSDA